MAIEHVTSLPNIAALKTQDGNISNIVLTAYALTIDDGLGKFYMFYAADTSTEDLVNYNVITPNSGIGRWKAIFIRNVSLPHGTLKIDGAIKTFLGGGTTAADGTCTLYLTVDGTPTGAAIFNNVLFDDSKANVDTLVANDAVSSCRKSLSADKKTLIHLFFRGASTAVSVFGINVVGFRTALATTPVLFMVTGK